MKKSHVKLAEVDRRPASMFDVSAPWPTWEERQTKSVIVRHFSLPVRAAFVDWENNCKSLVSGSGSGEGGGRGGGSSKGGDGSSGGGDNGGGAGLLQQFYFT